MSVETLGTSGKPKFGQYYPCISTQEFPETRKEYIKYSICRLPSSLIDAPDALVDGSKALIEFGQLHRHPIYRDSDIPKGDGSRIVIIPGFGGAGWMYRETVNNFRGLGYDVVTYPLQFCFNIEPTVSMVDDCAEFIVRERERIGRKISLYTHSKGGHLAWSVYGSYPDEFRESVDHFLNAASAVPEKVNLLVGAGYLVSQYFFGGDDFKLIRLARKNGYFRSMNGVRVTTLCVENDPIADGVYLGPLKSMFEVQSSHIGAFVNEDNLRFAAKRQARPKEMEEAT